MFRQNKDLGITRTFLKHFCGLLANLVTCAPKESEIPCVYVSLFIKSEISSYLEEHASIMKNDTILNLLVCLHNATA